MKIKHIALSFALFCSIGLQAKLIWFKNNTSADIHINVGVPEKWKHIKPGKKKVINVSRNAREFKVGDKSRQSTLKLMANANQYGIYKSQYTGTFSARAWKGAKELGWTRERPEVKPPLPGLPY